MPPRTLPMPQRRFPHRRRRGNRTSLFQRKCPMVRHFRPYLRPFHQRRPFRLVQPRRQIRHCRRIRRCCCYCCSRSSPMGRLRMHRPCRFVRKDKPRPCNCRGIAPPNRIVPSDKSCQCTQVRHIVPTRDHKPIRPHTANTNISVRKRHFRKLHFLRIARPCTDPRICQRDKLGHGDKPRRCKALCKHHP